MSAIIPRANSVEKMQVFWPWSSLRMSACTVPRTLASTHGPDLAGLVVGRRPGRARSAKASRRWSIAVFRNMARIVGAGPLMVIDTEVDGSHRSKPSKSTFMSSRVAIDTPELPTLP